MSYWDDIAEAYNRLSIYDGAMAFAREFARLPTHIGDLLAAHWVLSEVSNGGFHQFFANPTGVLAPEAAQGFDRMGLPEVADVMRRAMAHFDGNYPREQSDRESFLDSHRPEVFESLERQLYEIGSPSLKRIYEIMDEYARRNAEPGAPPEPPPAAAVRDATDTMNPKTKSKAPADGGGR
jgi:hypothetical protein